MAMVQSFSGIRGIYGRDITEDSARRYAYCFHQTLKKKLKREPLIVVGTDTRSSAHALKKAVFGSLANIIDVGVAPTPAVELAVRLYKADGGIIITASHNEPEWNGFKFLGSDGAVLRPKDAEKLIDGYKKVCCMPEKAFLSDFLCREKELGIKKIDGKQADLMEKYSDYILSFVKNDIGRIRKQKFRIVLDPNGGAGIIAGKILAKLGVDAVCVNCREGDFNRLVEPNSQSLKYLKKIIKESNADFAIGFDCDADRAEILLPGGEIVSGQYLLALAVDDVLSELKNPEKQVIVTNDATSGVVNEVAIKYGAKVKEVEVGEINVVDEMLRLKSQIGGEGSSSGVIMPPNRCRDGILLLLLILRIISKRGLSVEKIIKKLPKYYTLRKNLKIDITDIKKIKNKIKKYYENKNYVSKDSKDPSGTLKIWPEPGSWVFFRASRTEAGVLRVMADANSKGRAVKLLDEAARIIQ